MEQVKLELLLFDPELFWNQRDQERLYHEMENFMKLRQDTSHSISVDLRATLIFNRITAEVKLGYIKFTAVNEQKIEEYIELTLKDLSSFEFLYDTIKRAVKASLLRQSLDPVSQLFYFEFDTLQINYLFRKDRSQSEIVLRNYSEREYQGIEKIILTIQAAFKKDITLIRDPDTNILKVRLNEIILEEL